MIEVKAETAQELLAVEPLRKLMESEIGERAIQLLRELWQLLDRSRWTSVKEKMPKDFVSVIGHMMDAGHFPATRECYGVGNGAFYFPAIDEFHPVDYWMEIPNFEKMEDKTNGD